MSAEYLAAWAVCMVVACLVLLAVVVIVEVRDYHRSKVGRLVRPGSAPRPPRYAIERSSAAAVVHIQNPAAYEAFLGELIVTPHVEEALR